MNEIFIGHVQRNTSKANQEHYVGFVKESQSKLHDLCISCISGMGATKEEATDNFVNNLFKVRDELAKLCEQFYDGQFEIKEMDKYHSLIEED